MPIQTFDPADATGLSEAEATRRQQAEGFNEMPQGTRRGVFAIALEVMREPMFLLLVACGSLYLLMGALSDALMLLGFVFVVMGITIVQERRTERALDALREASYTDHLTGAGNRKLLFSQGLQLLDSTRRGGLPVSLLMLDLDFFKRVNDTHGHAAGDAVLAGFSALLRETLRKSDLFVRYGGEEFVVLAPNAGSSSVLELAERIRHAVELLEVPAGEAVLRFTVSIGASSLEGAHLGRSTPEAALEGLLARADEALYLAKGAGRNRVEYLPATATGQSAANPPAF